MRFRRMACKRLNGDDTAYCHAYWELKSTNPCDGTNSGSQKSMVSSMIDHDDEWVNCHDKYRLLNWYWYRRCPLTGTVSSSILPCSRVQSYRFPHEALAPLCCYLTQGNIWSWDACVFCECCYLVVGWETCSVINIWAWHTILMECWQMSFPRAFPPRAVLWFHMISPPGGGIGN